MGLHLHRHRRPNRLISRIRSTQEVGPTQLLDIRLQSAPSPSGLALPLPTLLVHQPEIRHRQSREPERELRPPVLRLR